MNSSKRVLPANEAADYMEWQEPLVEGVISSEFDGVMKPPTLNQMQSLHKAAYDEGFNMGRKEGHSQGYKEGLAKAEAETRSKLQSLTSICHVLSTPLEQLDDEVELNIAELSLCIARQLVRREIKIDPGEVIAVIREAVKALPLSARNPIIHLHPEDMHLVRDALSIGEEEKSWRLQEDLLLTRGDCRIETDSSFIDATVESRLSAIAVKLLGDEQRNDDVG